VVIHAAVPSIDPRTCAHGFTEVWRQMIMSTILTTALLVSPVAIPADGGRDVTPSTYAGKHYNARWETWRRCVVWRESRDNPKAANRSSSARGLYQFLDNSMAGVAHPHGDP
jgi:hypothetical protein